MKPTTGSKVYNESQGIGTVTEILKVSKTTMYRIAWDRGSHITRSGLYAADSHFIAQTRHIVFPSRFLA
jgi:hypothetical protein